MKKGFILLTVFSYILLQIFGLLGSNVFAADLTGTTSTNTPNIYDFITGLEITQTGPDDNLPPPLGDDVPQNSDFRMTYSFFIPQNSGLASDDYFYLTIPSYVDVPSDSSLIQIVDSSNSVHVLDVTMLTGASTPSGENSILVEFTQELEDNTDLVAFTGSFWFETNFDEGEVGEGGTITINFDSGRVSEPYAIDINFIEDPPVDPTLQKSNTRSWNSAEHRHYYTWTLDFNEENVDLGEGVVIIDPLPLSNSEMEYIGNVNQINGDASYTATYNSTEHTFTIEFTEAVSEQQTFTFQTAFYDSIYIDHLNNNDRVINVSNEARAETPVGTIYSNTSTRNYGIDVINKADVNVDVSNRTITWRIEANPNNYIVDDAYVTDNLPEGLIMDESSIAFYYDDNTPTDFSDNTIYPSGSWTVDNNGTPTDLDDDEYTFTLGDINEEIWIVFTTDIDDDLYYNQANDSFENSAYFHPPSTSTSRNRGRDIVPFTTDILQKSSTIDISTGIITWELRINPNTTATNPVRLEDLVVTDPIPDNITTNPTSTNNGLNYITGSLNVSPAVDTEVAGAQAYYDNINNEIVIDFDQDNIQDGGDVIEQEYVVTFQTQIADDYIYKINEDSEVTNIAYYTSNNAGDDSVSDDQPIQPDVIQKAFVSYDYDTHYFRWHINVNSNSTELDNALITDYISEDMMYVDSTFEIYDSSGIQYTGGAFNYIEHDPVIVNPADNSENITGTITYQFPATINDSYDIYFETEYIDLELLADNHLSLSTDYLEARNTVYLVHDDLPLNSFVAIFDGQRFTSSIMEKDSDYSSGEQYIEWVVMINKNQIEIYGPDPDPYPSNAYNGPVIYDTLQAGLVIDLESIELFDAEVHSDNSIDTDPDNDGISNSVNFDDEQVNYDANTRQLTFEFANDINSCYVMRFRTYIESGYNRDSFANTASFYALGGNQVESSEGENVLFVTGGGYAAANIGHLLVRKIDADSGLPLQGAVFELIDANGRVVDVQTTDSSGEALFEFVFFDRDYWYRESQTPYGYSGDTTSQTYFVIDSTTATDEGLNDPDRTYTTSAIRNYADPVTVEFMKYAEDGSTGLAGALFAIYDSDNPSLEISRATSAIDGSVTFSNLDANNTYLIREIRAPLGYFINPTVLSVSVTVGSVAFTPTPSSITNSRDIDAVNTVTFTKLGYDRTSPLEGCVFGIYSASSPDVLLGTAESLADGSVTFTNVGVGDFIIKEISTVSGYQISEEELTVTVGSTPGTYITTPSTMINYLGEQINPQTGDKTNYTIYYLILSLFGVLGVSFLYYIVKMNNTKSIE